ncbi:hypothetical protein IV203_002210 [Nitzschia inconspicua]|uniref:Uncharacterized protein n=1 Tax=Nitzschia inconspicua TaxID=303405 RepID=A0A9K3PS08_9STRA|nr:hypothetical protein IV203_002210 [Nitzschia inconspicua]
MVSLSILGIFVLSALFFVSEGFQILSSAARGKTAFTCNSNWDSSILRPRSGLSSGSDANNIIPDTNTASMDVTPPQTQEEKTKAVGNLVENDEWLGLTLELSELIRTAVIEDIKTNAREFLGKDNYEVGDISKEIDSRVKSEVARMRGKEDYEVGDLVMVMDKTAKELTSELTGKPYETGDLSKELDKRVKNALARYCGKEEGDYQFGDLSKEIDRRVKDRVSQYLGKDYEFGDITREVNNQRKAWVEDFLGKEAAEQYQFGDITKKAITNFTGKDKYEFGDVTKKLMNNIFKKDKQ